MVKIPLFILAFHRVEMKSRVHVEKWKSVDTDLGDICYKGLVGSHVGQASAL